MKNKLKNVFIVALSIIILFLFVLIFKYYENKDNISYLNNIKGEDYMNNNSSINFKEETDFYSIIANYPNDVIDRENVIKMNIESNIAKAKNDWRIDGEIYKDEQKLNKDFPDRAKVKYEKNISYKKYISKANGTVSYVLEDYEFTGGAHGATNLYTYTFNKDKELKIEDILDFNNGKDILLTKILRKSLLLTLGEDTNTQMLDNGLGLAYLDKDGNFSQEKCACDGFLFLSNFQNFIVLDDGIKFIFGQYAVAPYSSGMPEVLLNWSELKPYLKMFNN